MPVVMESQKLVVQFNTPSNDHIRMWGKAETIKKIRTDEKGVETKDPTKGFWTTVISLEEGNFEVTRDMADYDASMDEKNIPMPRFQSLWKHGNGNLYQVLAITNTEKTAPDPFNRYPITIVYQNVHTQSTWSRKLTDWHRSMVEVLSPQEKTQ